MLRLLLFRILLHSEHLLLYVLFLSSRHVEQATISAFGCRAPSTCRRRLHALRKNPYAPIRIYHSCGWHLDGAELVGT